MIRYWVKHVIDNGDGTTTLRAIEMKSETVAKGQSATVVEKDVEKKTFEGYKYDRAVALPSTFTDNSSSNSITLYYVKDETQTRTLSYTVEHYLDNALQTADTATVEEKFGCSILPQRLPSHQRALHTRTTPTLCSRIPTRQPFPERFRTAA